jgi:hypothetical protein
MNVHLLRVYNYCSFSTTAFSILLSYQTVGLALPYKQERFCHFQRMPFVLTAIRLQTRDTEV